MRHPDEGTIHAWLDGALDDAETAWIETHTRECPACGALVAEARGLVAGASRVLGALDAVPGGVLPVRHGPVGTRSGSGEVSAGRVIRRFAGRTTVGRSSRWVAPVRAAAALLLVAAGTAVVMRSTDMPAFRMESAEVRGDVEAAVAVPATGSAMATATVQQALADAAADMAATDSAMPATGAATAGAAAAEAAPVAAAPMASRSVRAPAPVAAIEPQREESNDRRVERKLLEVAAAAIGRPAARQRPITAPLAMRPAPDSLTVAPTEVVVTGTVRDDRTGEPVAGASILLDNGDLGTITDHLGRFTITGTTNGVHRAQVRRMGYASVEHQVKVVGDSSVLDVRLAPAGTSVAAALGEGYTDVKREPEQRVTGERLEERLRRAEKSRDDRPRSRTESAAGSARADSTTASSAATANAAPPSAPASPGLPFAADAPERSRASVPLATSAPASALKRRASPREVAGACLTIELSTVGSADVARSVAVRLLSDPSRDTTLDGRFAIAFPLAGDGATMRGSWSVVPRAGEDERTATDVRLHWVSGDEEVHVSLDWARTQPAGQASVRRGRVGVDARATATRLECRALKIAP